MQVTGAGLSAGTPNYMAPEVLGQGAEPSPPQDLYALGVMIGELTLGRTMWAAQSLEVLYAAKTTNKAIEDVPPRFRPLVKKLTARDPAARPTAAQARDELRKLDRATTDPVGHMATANVAPVATDDAEPDLGKLDGNLDLVSLDGRSPTQQVGPPPAAFAPPPSAVGIPKDLELEPVADTKLEIESGWSQERDAKVAGKPAVKPTMFHAKRSGGGAGSVLLALLLLGGVAAGGYYFMTKEQSTAPQAKKVDVDRGVTIRIVGKSGTAITIDGKPAGKTPVRLERRASKQEIEIAAPGFVRRVVPDRDQTIDISRMD